MASNSTASPLVAGDIAWILTSSSLVFLQIPALGLFYSGLSDQKNSLTTLLAVLLCFCVVAIQWVLFGFSLSFSDTSHSNFIGNFDYGFLKNTMDTQNMVAGTIPNALLAMYQMMFACITPGLLIGGIAGRMRLLPMMIFVFLWTTIVYDPIAYWTWSSNGWLHNLNCLDYAGGSVVHLSSGVTGFMLAPHNPAFVYIGTALLWFGWNGFNGGSALGSNERAVGAAFATNIAAAAKRFSAIAFCNGVVIALVAITPGSGYIQPGVALFLFVHWLGVDDTLEVGASHGVGGAFGMILTGIFAQFSITNVDVAGLAGIAAVTVWTAGWTCIIVLAVNMIPGLKMRCHKDAEAVGLDTAEVGEVSYPVYESVATEEPSKLEKEEFLEPRITKPLGDVSPHPSQATLADNGIEIICPPVEGLPRVRTN
ncbi:Rh-like protein/ammonium transporter [Rhizoclosmatium globosum]|uniref:Rh-like protein/ammonium transporter n=1 Tax=Rhizoclosmatium globosum TaxID=329046 RepID=A0A1Y2CLH6_9FUNG|nr:Rh-like protein/ammonium transporter [Rhizoclosmatium globosum]|eukprot:ORY47879.1 Rh-like protein/ammonium transporter [Rhizoclosmatium globosum]